MSCQPERRATAGKLGLDPDALEPTLVRLLDRLERWIVADAAEEIEAVRGRDALLGRQIRWAGGRGEGAGIDADGRLLVRTDDGEQPLDAGEVHLLGQSSAPG